MKYICDKCGEKFESIMDCTLHEQICGVPDEMLITIVTLGISIKSLKTAITSRTIKIDNLYNYRPIGEVTKSNEYQYEVNIKKGDELQGWQILIDHVINEKWKDIKNLQFLINGLVEVKLQKMTDVVKKIDNTDD